MTGESIVCFTKDWAEDDATCTNHVMRRLAQRNKVLWLNSVSTRRPQLLSGRDRRRILRKVAACLRGPHQVQDSLWVYTPVVLPLPHSPWALRLNRLVLRTALRFHCRRLGFHDVQLWSFLPNVSEYLGCADETVAVYYCADEWSLFSGIDKERTLALEEALCRKADIVFATAQSLVDKRRPWNPDTHLASHGVDYKLFSRALLQETSVPPDLAALPRPVIGFYGTLDEWVDYPLLEQMASRHPEWSIALLGRERVDLSSLRRYPNVHILGPKPHQDLPGYCKGFSAALIPYQLTERILHVNPVKLREYLCAGLPVISTPLPEVQRYEHLCAIRDTPEAFCRAVEDGVATDTPERRRERNEAMRTESWDEQVKRLCEQVMRVKAAKAARGGKAAAVATP